MTCPNLHFSAKSLSSSLKLGLTARCYYVGYTTQRSDAFFFQTIPFSYSITKQSCLREMSGIVQNNYKAFPAFS